MVISIIFVTLSGLMPLPMALPVLKPDNLIKYLNILKLNPGQLEVNNESELPQHYANRFGWEEIVKQTYLA